MEIEMKIYAVSCATADELNGKLSNVEAACCSFATTDKKKAIRQMNHQALEWINEVNAVKYESLEACPFAELDTTEWGEKCIRIDFRKADIVPCNDTPDMVTYSVLEISI